MIFALKTPRRRASEAFENRAKAVALWEKSQAMVAYPNIYDGLADLIASMDPPKVLAFHAPAAMQSRVEFLLEQKREKGLSGAEKEELDHYFILEHIVRLAKSRARLRLSQLQS